MFKDITIGQYIDTGSFLHKMDARIKIILTILYMVTLFVIDGLVPYIAFTVFTVFLVILSTVDS